MPALFSGKLVAPTEPARRRRFRPHPFDACLGLLIALFIASTIFYCIERQSGFLPLDWYLKHRAHNPQALLQTLQHSKTPGIYEDEIQHLALLRLLDLQESHFHNTVPAPTEEGNTSDTLRARGIGYNRSRNIIISGTPARIFLTRSRDGYYANHELQLFEFTPQGRLVSRSVNTLAKKREMLLR